MTSSDLRKSSGLQFSEDILIPTPWGHFSAKTWGPKSGTPVLALHGLLDNAGTYDALVPYITSNVYLVCLEFCGHGCSSPYPPGIIVYYNDYPYHIKIVIDHFGWDQVILLGHSIGAIAAMQFTAMYPTMVTKLISLDILKPYSVATEKLVNRLKFMLTQFETVTTTDPMGLSEPMTYKEAQNRLVQNYMGSIDEKAAEILLKRGLKKHTDKDLYKFTCDLRSIVQTLVLNEDQIKAIVSNITCPLLIIKARNGLQKLKDDVLNEYVDIYRKSSAEFCLVEVEGTHHVHLTHPELVAPYINEFLSKPSSKL